MSSLCIKTNNEEILTYLQNEFSEFNMLNVFFSKHEFKSYKNIIIHYKGIDNELFYTKLATLLSYIVIDYLEQNILKNILYSNYFYFDKYEINKSWKYDWVMGCDIFIKWVKNKHLPIWKAKFVTITKIFSA